MITLPNCPPIRNATPRLISYATDQTPTLGGPQTRVLRMGTRWGIDVTTYPALYDGEGRVYLSRLVRGVTDTVLLPFPEPGMRNQDYGSPVISAAGAFGQSIQVSGLGAGRVVPEGKFLSIVTGGQRFLYQTTSQVTADGTGAATLSIYPMLRRQPALGDVVELSQPKIEGYVQGNEIQWDVTKSKRIGYSFTIVERE